MHTDEFDNRVKHVNSIYRPILFITGLAGAYASRMIEVPHSALYVFAIIIASIEWVALVYSSMV